MFSPCEMCFQRYGKQYSEECDETCEYAKLYKALSDILEYIKDREEHHASQWSYKRAFNYDGAAMQHATLQSELSTMLHYIDKNILSKYGVMEKQTMDTQPCAENKPDYNDILSYIDKLLNQATGKKKSLEFLKKYIEGSTNTASNHVKPVTNTTTYTNATDYVEIRPYQATTHEMTTGENIVWDQIHCVGVSNPIANDDIRL